MTDTNDTPGEAADSPRPRTRRSRRAVVVAGALAVLAAIGVTIGVLVSGGTPLEKAPTPVLGRSLRPLVVYQPAGRSVMTPHPKVGPGERALPPASGINPVIILRKPVISLHILYARVAPFGGSTWEIELLAGEGAAFNGATTGGKAYVTIIDGKTTSLFPLYEVNGPAVSAPNQPQYVLGYRWPTEAAAIAAARMLTTSVTAAHCTQAQIDKYRCE